MIKIPAFALGAALCWDWTEAHPSDSCEGKALRSSSSSSEESPFCIGVIQFYKDYVRRPRSVDVPMNHISGEIYLSYSR